MATQINGAQGAVRGKIGNLVYCQWKGINYVRMRPKVNKKRIATAGQQQARSRFRFMQQALEAIVPLVRIGFMHYAPNQTGHNGAMSYNLREAVRVENEQFVLDYAKFSFAKGQPNPITSVDIEQTADHYILHWTYDKAIRNKYDQDGYRVTFLAYSADTDDTFALEYGNPLNVNSQSIPVEKLKRHVDLHLYIAFQAADGSNISTDSMYIGMLPKQVAAAGAEEEEDERNEFVSDEAVVEGLVAESNPVVEGGEGKLSVPEASRKITESGVNLFVNQKASMLKANKGEQKDPDLSDIVAINSITDPSTAALNRVAAKPAEVKRPHFDAVPRLNISRNTTKKEVPHVVSREDSLRDKTIVLRFGSET